MKNQAKTDIDWERPIQTTTGQRAEVVGERRHPMWYGGEPIRLVCVYQDGSPVEDSLGDIYQVNKAGQQVDASTRELSSQVVMIRNVPRKREAWILVAVGRGMISHRRVFETEKEAWANSVPSEVVAHAVWEEP